MYILYSAPLDAFIRKDGPVTAGLVLSKGQATKFDTKKEALAFRDESLSASSRVLFDAIKKERDT